MRLDYFVRLSEDAQAAYLRSLDHASLIQFTLALDQYLALASKHADRLADKIYQPQTTEKARYTFRQLRMSKDQTLVDIIAEHPELKQFACVRQLIADDFAKYLPKCAKH
jgi:hypothetical protein